MGMIQAPPGRESLEQLMGLMRPRLHRYCARMLGSAFDGEDVVQEALAKAAEALPDAGALERPEAWLFRIAHNTALDALRRRKRQPKSGSGFDLTLIVDDASRADARVAASSSLATFLHLPTGQRSSLILADVLGHSLEETADILGMTLAAVKAALHRGREHLRRLEHAPGDGDVHELDADERARLRDYADRFNARDFDALRDLLAEEVRLDLANRRRLEGRKDVSFYFTRYSQSADWRFASGLAEGRPALLVSDPADPAGAVRYVVLLGWADGRIISIRDFRYAPYVVEGLAIAPL